MEAPNLGVLLLIKKEVWHLKLIKEVESFIQCVTLNAHL